MSQTRTRAELVLQALEDLNVLQSGQTAEVEDLARVDDAAPSIMSTLRATEVYYLNSIEAVPDEAFLPLAAIIAWECRAKFSITDPNELAMLKSKNDSAVASLKIMTRGRPTYQPLRSEFF